MDPVLLPGMSDAVQRGSFQVQQDVPDVSVSHYRFMNIPVL